MQNDIFISSNTDSKRYAEEHKDNNFFMQPQQIAVNSSVREKSKHINGYDHKILENEAYQEVNDEVFKLEYKINKLEQELANIENKIIAANEIADVQAINNLMTTKDCIISEINELYKIYNDISLSAKISGGVTNSLKTNFSSYKLNLFEKLSKFLSKVSGKLSVLIALKQSLQKLKSISKNVDELVSLQIPYGEATEKYSQLSKYILKANNIQSEISKHIK